MPELNHLETDILVVGAGDRRLVRPGRIQRRQRCPPVAGRVRRAGRRPRTKTDGNHPARACRAPDRHIAAITQHILPDKSFQLVRYYGWYSNKMHGRRDKHAAEEAAAASQAVQIIDFSEHHPRRIPSAKWRELIKKVWEDKVPEPAEGPIRCYARSARKKCASWPLSTSVT